MGRYDFDSVIDRRNTACQKWDNLERVFGDGDILALWKADMDFKAPPEVLERLRRRLDHGIFGYPNRPDDFYDAILRWMEERHGWRVRREWICHSPGVTPALAFAMLAFTRPGEKVMIQSPIYPPFPMIVRENGRQLVDNPLVLRNGRYEIDFDDLEEKLDSRVRMLFFCSPQNPTGRVWTRDELERLGDICRKKNVLIVSDEVHCDIVYRGRRHIPLASISEDLRRRTLTCISPSKTFNLAGFRSAVVIIPDEELRNAYNALIEGMHLAGVTVFGSEAIAAAYSCGGPWLNELMEYLEENLDFVDSFLRKRIPEIHLIRPEGTYVPLLDCRGLKIDSAELQNFLVKKARVGMNPGPSFGGGCENFARMTIAAPRSVLREGLERIEGAVAELRG